MDRAATTENAKQRHSTSRTPRRKLLIEK